MINFLSAHNGLISIKKIIFLPFLSLCGKWEGLEGKFLFFSFSKFHIDITNIYHLTLWEISLRVPDNSRAACPVNYHYKSCRHSMGVQCAVCSVQWSLHLSVALKHRGSFESNLFMYTTSSVDRLTTGVTTNSNSYITEDINQVVPGTRHYGQHWGHRTVNTSHPHTSRCQQVCPLKLTTVNCTAQLVQPSLLSFTAVFILTFFVL